MISNDLSCIIDTKSSEHILHLYSSKVNKQLIHKSFFDSMEDDEDAIIISSDEQGKIINELDLANVNLKVLSFDGLNSLNDESDKKTKIRLIIDTGSLPSQTYEQIWEREQNIIGLIAKNPIRCLCTYRINALSEQMIKPLSKLHTLLQLTTNDLALISGEFIESLQVSYDSIKKNVKDNLDIIILSLMQEKMMTGLDIMKTINMEFNVLLSPGAVYPLLDSLQKKGLLSSMRMGKERIYKTTSESESEIQQLISDQIQARKMLNNYLQSRSNLQMEAGQLVDNTVRLNSNRRRDPWLD